MPSTVVRDKLAGWGPRNLRVVPNALLADASVAPPTPSRREQLRRSGPVRVLARLGPEKGVLDLLEAAAGWDRPVEVALAEAGFEASAGSQSELLKHCHQAAARTPGVRLRGALAWDEVLPWLAQAAVVIVPSHKETFGLVALEAMSVGTPVVAYRVGNLPALIDPTGHGDYLLVDHDGAAATWRPNSPPRWRGRGTGLSLPQGGTCKVGSLRRNCPDQVVEVAVGGSSTPFRPLSPTVEIGPEQRS